MKIVVLYHSPCLDGAFSLLTFFLFVKTLLVLSKKGENVLNFLYEKLLKSGFGEEKGGDTGGLCEEEVKIDKENFKEFLYCQEISEMFLFYAVKPSKKSENLGETMKKIQSKVDLKETILILLDYFAENESNLVKLSESSKKLIVIDHHQSFFDILNYFIFLIFLKITKPKASSYQSK